MKELKIYDKKGKYILSIKVFDLYDGSTQIRYSFTEYEYSKIAGLYDLIGEWKGYKFDIVIREVYYDMNFDTKTYYVNIRIRRRTMLNFFNRIFDKYI